MPDLAQLNLPDFHQTLQECSIVGLAVEFGKFPTSFTVEFGGFPPNFTGVVSCGSRGGSEGSLEPPFETKLSNFHII